MVLDKRLLLLFPGRSHLLRLRVTVGSYFHSQRREGACPGVSRDMIRRVLRRLQKDGSVQWLGRGTGASAVKRRNNLKRGY